MEWSFEIEYVLWHLDESKMNIRMDYTILQV